MITAKIIKDSISPFGQRLTTFELEYPRYLHSQLMTHRMFSRNSASSRAVPVKRMLALIDELGATTAPDQWPIQGPGMQPKGYKQSDEAEDIWEEAKRCAIEAAAKMLDAGIHKEIANRLTEPFQHIKVVVSATEWANAIYVRTHGDAQSGMQQLFSQIKESLLSNEPELIEAGEWHLPYIFTRRVCSTIHYFDSTGQNLTLDQAQQVSASCCAQVSYRRLDESLQKAQDIFNRMINSDPLHASAFEHQATPFELGEYGARKEALENLRNAGIWAPEVMFCGNFQGWTQYRKLLPGENHTGMIEAINHK